MTNKERQRLAAQNHYARTYGGDGQRVKMNQEQIEGTSFPLWRRGAGLLGWRVAVIDDRVYAELMHPAGLSADEQEKMGGLKSLN